MLRADAGKLQPRMLAHLKMSAEYPDRVPNIVSGACKITSDS